MRNCINGSQHEEGREPLPSRMHGYTNIHELKVPFQHISSEHPVKALKRFDLIRNETWKCGRTICCHLLKKRSCLRAMKSTLDNPEGGCIWCCAAHALLQHALFLDVGNDVLKTLLLIHQDVLKTLLQSLITGCFLTKKIRDNVSIPKQPLTKEFWYFKSFILSDSNRIITFTFYMKSVKL